jgi:hypothetical protein
MYWLLAAWAIAAPSRFLARRGECAAEKLRAVDRFVEQPFEFRPQPPRVFASLTKDRLIGFVDNDAEPRNELPESATGPPNGICGNPGTRARVDKRSW